MSERHWRHAPTSHTARLGTVDRAQRVHLRVPAARSASPTSRAPRYPRLCPRSRRVRGLSGGGCCCETLIVTLASSARDTDQDGSTHGPRAVRLADVRQAVVTSPSAATLGDSIGADCSEAWELRSADGTRPGYLEWRRSTGRHGRRARRSPRPCVRGYGPSVRPRPNPRRCGRRADRRRC
jgi:hypothetical protein